MTGLKICTRWRAISARRSRRINSSLLPENIGPTIPSIQPMLPLTMSTLAAALAARVGINRRGQLRAAVEYLHRERCGDQDAARLAEGTAPGAVGDVGP